jgi:hypothetical protein
VGSLTSHNPIGLQGLLRDSFILLYFTLLGTANTFTVLRYEECLWKLWQVLPMFWIVAPTFQYPLPISVWTSIYSFPPCFRFYRMGTWYSPLSEQRTTARKFTHKCIYVWRGTLLDRSTPEMSTWELVRFRSLLLRNWDGLLALCTVAVPVHLSQQLSCLISDWTNPAVNIRSHMFKRAVTFSFSQIGPSCNQGHVTQWVATGGPLTPCISASMMCLNISKLFLNISKYLWTS